MLTHGRAPYGPMSCSLAACVWHRPRLGSSANARSSRRTRPTRSAAAQASSTDAPKKVAVFVSGGGSNLRALHQAMRDGTVNATVAAVVSNSGICGGVEWAKTENIPTLKYPPTKAEKEKGEGMTPTELVEQLDALDVSFVCLAGYLRLIPPELCQRYENKMLNIHPALLPGFGGKGMHGTAVHEAVVASGARWTGPTIHFVNEKFDEGKILAQRVLPVFPSDTPDAVAARVLEEEHKVFPHALAALVDGRVEFREDGVPKILTEDGEE